MDIYYDEQTTPLKYHKFLKYFGLPLNILITFSTLVRAIGSIPDLGAYSLFDAVFAGVSLVLLVMTMHGFYTWSPNGFYCMISQLVLGVVYNFLALLIVAGIAPSEIAAQTGSVIGSLVTAIPIGIYYCKRRPLFIESLRSAYIYERIRQARPDGDDGVVHLDDRSGGDAMICRVCGNKLNPERGACMRCGATRPKVPVSTVSAPVQPQPQSISPRFCRKCGTKLAEGSSFCHKCGTQVPMSH